MVMTPTLLHNSNPESDGFPPFQHLDTSPNIQADQDTPHISLHASVGNAANETLQNNGTTKNKDIVILVDGGSTQNFIQGRIVKFLGFQYHSHHAFKL